MPLHTSIRNESFSVRFQHIFWNVIAGNAPMIDKMAWKVSKEVIIHRKKNQQTVQHRVYQGMSGMGHKIQTIARGYEAIPLWAKLPYFAGLLLLVMWMQPTLPFSSPLVNNEQSLEQASTQEAIQKNVPIAANEPQPVVSSATPVLVQETRPVVHQMPSQETLRVARIGFDVIKYFEGLRLKPYHDAAKKATIGYGHLLHPKEPRRVISATKAEELLQSDVANAERVVRENVTVPLTISQYSALVSLVYNIGEKPFRSSTLLKHLNQGYYDMAAEEIRRWEVAGGKVQRGLSHRRHAEYLLFTGKWKKKANA
jgi:lysozyme